MNRDASNFRMLRTVRSSHQWLEVADSVFFFESASYHVKFSPNGTGGSLVKMVLTYTPMPGANSAQFEKMIKGGLEGVMKGCEAFLLANPDAYN